MREKPGHSRVGLARAGGGRVFAKQYTGVSWPHFEVERAVLDRLRATAARSFYVDYLGSCDSERTLFFPRFPENLTEYAARVGVGDEDVLALCEQMTCEVAAVRRATPDPAWCRALTPFHFLTRVLGDDTPLRPALSALAASGVGAVVTRYDPQMDNFLVADNWLVSHDFSMLRVMHPFYPFAYLLHDLYERSRVGLDPAEVERAVLGFLRDHSPYSALPDHRKNLLLCRAEALAHEVDGFRRRGNQPMARHKAARLTAVLREWEECE